MSTPDAAPVEVEGGWAWWCDAAEADDRCFPDAPHAGCGWKAGPPPSTPPAAPTTPDIADERVAELRAWLIERMVAADDRVVTSARSGDQSRYDFHRGQSKAFMQSINALDRALATPSTPGAGQADEQERGEDAAGDQDETFGWPAVWCGIPAHNVLGENHYHCGHCGEPSSMYGHKVNGAWTCSEPAAGQGEPS